MSNPRPDQHDRTIETTLAALRQVLPPAGLEQRVLQTLAEREAAKSGQPGKRRSFPWLAVPIAACAVLAVLAVFLPGHHARPVTTITSAALPAPTTLPLATVPASAQAPFRVLASAQLPSRPRAVRVFRNSHPRQAASQTSAPPPPAPLTQEERLLIQIARSGDPKQLAMLNPDLRARDEARDDAEFRQFFNAPHTQNP